MAIAVEQISDTFSILTPNMEVRALPFDGPAFYERLDQEFGGFSGHVLISSHSFNSAWPTWECHPNGDECVILLSGSATMVLLQEGEEHSTTLDTAGQYIIVPRGAWHTASAADNATMMFITPGDGTENRENPPRD